MREVILDKMPEDLSVKLAEEEFSGICKSHGVELIEAGAGIRKSFRLAINMSLMPKNQLQKRTEILTKEAFKIADKHDLRFECEGPVYGFGGKEVLLYVRYSVIDMP